jgi:hypothetical protein
MLTRTTMTIEIDLPLCPGCPIKVIPKKGDLMDYQAAELAQQIFTSCCRAATANRQPMRQTRAS